MITTTTVFILGAVASIPYGFPSGGELLTKICQKRPEEYTRFGCRENHTAEFLNALRGSDYNSVDAFLEHRPAFMDVGKIAIAWHLVTCENAGHLSGDWYAYLLNNKLDCSLEELGRNRFSVITFNYDRSFEHYLFKCLCHRSGRSKDDVAQVINKIPVIHVHGRLGYLPWQEADSLVKRDYTTDESGVKVAASGIKSISEKSLEESEEFRQAHELMEKADRICVLGFGYHKDNMRRLLVPLAKSVHGTAYGFTQAEREYLTDYRYKGLTLFDYPACEFLRKSLAFQMA
jgi:hypothetical protein